MPLQKPTFDAETDPTLCSETLHILQDIVHSAPATLYRLNLPDITSAAYVSPNVLENLGIALELASNAEEWLKRVHINDVEQMTDEFFAWLKAPEQLVLKREYRLRDDKGFYRWVADTGKKKLVNNEAVAIIGCVADISTSRIEHERLKKIAAVSPSVIYQLKQDAAGEFSFPYVSAKLKTILGLHPTTAAQNAKSVFHQIHQDDRDKVVSTLAASKENLTPWEKDYRVVVKGAVRWLRDNAVPEKSHDGAVIWSGVAIDVTEQKNLEENLRQLSITDPLTRLANRRHFMIESERLITSSMRHGRPFSILMYDLDHFKRVNDTYGHSVGDDVLVQISELVQGRVRACDLVARIGGEEFIVLLPDTDLTDAKTLAEELRQHIENIDFEVNGEQFKVTVTFGVTTYNVTDRSPDDLLKRVDKLLYEGKQSGRNKVVAAT